MRGSTSGFVPRFFAAPVTEYPGERSPSCRPSSGRSCCSAAGASPPPPPSARWRSRRRSTRSSRARVPAARLRAAREGRSPRSASWATCAPFLVADRRGRRRVLEELGDRPRRRPARRAAGAGPPLGRAAAGLLRPVPLQAAAAQARARSRRAARCSPRSTARRTGAARRAHRADEHRAADAREHGGRPAPGGARGLVARRRTRRGGGRGPLGRHDARTPTSARGASRCTCATRAAARRHAHDPARPIELRSPLRELGFDQGSVRFTADLQGTAFRFKGTLESNTVTGNIERTRQGAGPFTLQFVE